MKAGRYKAAKRTLLIILAFLISVTVFIVVFADESNLPSSSDIYELFGLSPNQQYDDYISFLDVGQGDSILIGSNGYYALIDTGPPEAADDLLGELGKSGVDGIDVLLISHLHIDHVGGIESVIDNYSVVNLILPDLTGESEGYPAAAEAKEYVLSAKGGVYTAKAGMNVNIGDFEITVLGYYPDMADENNRSIIAMARIDGYKFLLTADSQAGVENRLLLDGINIDCDVLKVGHHGSKTSSCKDFIKAASPEFSVISVGAGNRYNHPSATVLETLEEADSQILRTDNSGTVTFYIENESLNYKLEYEQ